MFNHEINTMDLQDDFVKKMIEEVIPIYKFLGLELLQIEKDDVKVRVPFRTEVVGDIRSNRDGREELSQR